MEQLLCHLFGDFVLQNHAMATRKTTSSAWCALHAVTYTLPFLLLTRSPWALAVIVGTHFVIDRFSIAKRWPAFWGVGEPGWVMEMFWNRAAFVARQEAVKAYADEKPKPADAMEHTGRLIACIQVGNEAENAWRKANPLPDPAPVWLAVWLAIIVDNTFHMTINYLALRWL